MKLKYPKIIYNRIIPFPGFLAINLFGIIFVRKSERYIIDKVTINHELIHTAQMRELLYVFFYLIYFFEWIMNLFIDYKNAYKNISFEKEAYKNQNNLNYLDTRKLFSQWKNKK